SSRSRWRRTSRSPLAPAARSSRASPRDDGLDGLEDDDDVERHLQVLDVVQVVLQLLDGVLNAGAVRIADLRPAREPRLQHVTLAVIRDLVGQLPDEFRSFRTRTDEAHLTDEHVPELRH